MAESSDNPRSSSSKDDEYSDPLEVAASAAAIFNKHISKVVLFEYNHVVIVIGSQPIQRSRFLGVGLRETQSYNIDESV